MLKAFWASKTAESPSQQGLELSGPVFKMTYFGKIEKKV